MDRRLFLASTMSTGLIAAQQFNDIRSRACGRNRPPRPHQGNHSHAGTGRRSRRLRGQRQENGRPLHSRPRSASGRTPRRTSARRSPSGKSPPARWASAPPPCPRPKPWPPPASAASCSPRPSSMPARSAAWSPSPSGGRRHALRRQPASSESAGRSGRSGSRRYLDVLVDLDVGDRRTGSLPGEPALELAKHIARSKRLRVRGVQAYAGHASHTVGFEDRQKVSRTAMAKAVETTPAAGEGRLRREDSLRRQHRHLQHRPRDRRHDRAAGRLVRLHGRRLSPHRRRRTGKPSTPTSSRASPCSPPSSTPRTPIASRSTPAPRPSIPRRPNRPEAKELAGPGLRQVGRRIRRTHQRNGRQAPALWATASSSSSRTAIPT